VSCKTISAKAAKVYSSIEVVLNHWSCAGIDTLCYIISFLNINHFRPMTQHNPRVNPTHGQLCYSCRYECRLYLIYYICSTDTQQFRGSKFQCCRPACVEQLADAPIQDKNFARFQHKLKTFLFLFGASWLFAILRHRNTLNFLLT